MNNHVSVIIPFYNASGTLRLCVDSILPQLSKNDELILVDDASTDGGIILPEDQRMACFQLKENQGAAAARSTGAKEAENEILVFVDSDIVLKGNEIQRVKDHFSNHHDVACITGTLDARHRPHNFFTDYKNIYMSYIFSKCSSEVNFIYGAFCASRKSSFVFWPERPRLGEDSHWGYLQSKKNLKIHLVKDISVIHLKRYGFVSLALNDYTIAKNFAFLFLKYRRWKTIYTEEKFGHTSKNQKISLLLSMLTLVTIFIYPFIGFLLVSLWLILNYQFLFYMRRERGFTFFLKSLFWTFLDHIIYSAGILAGSLNYLRNP